MLTLVPKLDSELMGTSLLDIRMVKNSKDSTILSVRIVMLLAAHLLVSPTVNVITSFRGVKSEPMYSVVPLRFSNISLTQVFGKILSL